MNLVPHGILLQVTVWLINFQYGFRLCSGGEPGYLDFDNLPETNFSCQGKVIGGYYADVETGCQMFHVCTFGQKDDIMDIKFLCLNGTVFDQETRVCERVDEVDCSKSEGFYNLNLELYGNNAVTLSLHDVSDDEGEPTESIDDQHSTTSRSITTTTTTTTQRPTNPPATPTTTVYHQHNNGYSQHYQNQPLYSTQQTSQSKSLYDDKNSGYHHQYIFHNGEQANNQATSFQLFSNQGVSSTTNQPQIHQARYGTTSAPQIILNGPSTVAPLFHGVSSTIQTLLNSNANNPTFINPLFHNHGIPSTTEHFTIHSNNPRETQEYHEDGEQSEERSRRPLEAVQSTNQGKISKLSISPVPSDSEEDEDSDESDDHSTTVSQKVTKNYLTTPTTSKPTARSFYPTPRTSTKSESPNPTQIIQHIHLSPLSPIPQLKPQQITINLPPPDIQRIVQNPSPLLPSQSRVIVTAKASVSDESGRPLNTSELVVLPLPTIPVSYDDYKEGDESFDPFYRDVPKIRRARSAPQQINFLENSNGKANALNRHRRAVRRLKRAVSEDQNDYEDEEGLTGDYDYPASEEDEDAHPLFTDSEEALDIATIKANFKKFKALLLGHKLSDEISSGEMKSSKKYFGGMKSGFKTPYDEDKINDEKDETGSDNPEEEGAMQSGLEDTEDSIDHQEANGHTDSGDFNDEDNVELSTAMKTSENEGQDDVKSVTVAKATERPTESETESPSEIQKADDQPDSSVAKIDTKTTHGPKSIPERKKSLDESLKGTKNSVSKEDAKIMKSSRGGKQLAAEEEADTGETSKVATSDDEETAKPKSVVTTMESDAEEYIEPDSVLNTKESDLEEYVESKSILSSKDSDVEESDEPKIINAKESDPKEHVKPKTPEMFEKTDARAVDEESEKIVPVSDTEKSLDDEVLDDEEQTAPTLSHEAIPEITPTIKLAEKDAEGRKFEKKILTEDIAGKVKLDPKAKINHSQFPKQTEDTPSNEDDSTPEGIIKTEMTVDVGEMKDDEKIVEPETEKTDDLIDTVKAEEVKPLMKVESSEAEENDEPETEDSDVEKDTRSEGLGEISKVSQENEKSVMPGDMESDQAAVEQKPEVEEKLADHSMAKEPDSLVEEGESTASMKNSTLGKNSETTMKPEGIKETESSQLQGEKEYLKSSKEDTGEKKPSNDAELPDSKKEKKEKYPEKNGKPLSSGDRVDNSSEKKLPDDNSAEKSSESPNKIPSDLLDCNQTSEKHEKHSYEDSGGEYEDYPSAEYDSESGELETYERSDEEIGSHEPTSEYTDSGYDSDEGYSTSEEDGESPSREVYSTEDSRSTMSYEDYSTEGVLKFTDEIPEHGKKHSKQKNRERVKAKVSSEDYVDDNYEPEHYRENSEERNHTLVDSIEEKEPKTASEEDKLNDEAVDDKLTTSTSTTTTTTTTARPTPPSLFRPISVRKNYNFIPPTTTPNPVVIRHRFGLVNPRPAKPVKSYNELAPKPVIRKSPLSLRKPFGSKSTTTTEKQTLLQRRIDDLEDSSEIIWTSTEYIDEDEEPRENKLTRSANDVSFNETNGASKNDKEDYSAVDSEEDPPKDTNFGTETTQSITSAYLTTPYPLLKATTSGSLVVEEVRDGEFKDTKMVQIDEPTTVTPKVTHDEESSENSTGSSAAIEQTSMTDEKPTIFDGHKEEVETPRVSQIPFTCIGKELYRFYSDPRDCRLFHYCSPGFTTKQMLDFRFVCENTTMFDEDSQSCRYDIENSKCANRQW